MVTEKKKRYQHTALYTCAYTHAGRVPIHYDSHSVIEHGLPKYESVEVCVCSQFLNPKPQSADQDKQSQNHAESASVLLRGPLTWRGPHADLEDGQHRDGVGSRNEGTENEALHEREAVDQEKEPSQPPGRGGQGGEGECVEMREIGEVYHFLYCDETVEMMMKDVICFSSAEY